MEKAKKYLPWVALSMAIFLSACKNETKTPASASTETINNTTNIEADAAKAKAKVDSLAIADAAAAKQDSITNAAAEKEKISKTTVEKGDKITAKTNMAHGGKATPTLPKTAPKPALPNPPKKNGNVVKRKGKDDVFTMSEVKPNFPGGDAAMMKYLKGNIKYPARAKDDGIKGTVFIRFVVEKDGSVADVEVAKSVNPMLDSEAQRVVKSMPKWTAGKQNGTNVAVQYTLPVKFDLIE